MHANNVILVVEDDSADYIYLERIVRKMGGFQLIQATTLEQAITELSNTSVELILLDLTLPDNRDVNAIPKLSEKSNTPVVVLSGLDNEDMAYHAVQLGAQDYLVKGSFDSLMLMKTIRYAIERYRLVHELNETRLAVQREIEQRRISTSIPSLTPTVTANSYGQHSLRESDRATFDDYINQYQIILKGAVEQRAFKVDNDIPQKLRALATQFGKRRVAPRDVVELHTVTLDSVTKNTSTGKSAAYNEEGRYLLIGLLGHLCTFYRSYSISLLKLPHEQPSA